MAIQGLEPWTFALLARRSNQLSYTAWISFFRKSHGVETEISRTFVCERGVRCEVEEPDCVCCGDLGMVT